MTDAPESTETKVCERHGLALTPEGRCVMCGLDSIVVPPPSRAPSWVAVGLGVFALAALGVAGAAWMGSDDPPADIAVPAPDEPVVRSAPAEAPLSREVRRQWPVEVPVPQESPPVPSAVAPAPAVPPPPVQEAEPPDPPAQPEAAANKAPDKYALAAARRRVNIKMYATSWCGVCRKARAYMSQEGISFTEIDVEKSPSASRRHVELNPKGSVPTFEIDGEVLVGFSARYFERMVNRAARSRL